jgi:hypothetical protein
VLLIKPTLVLTIVAIVGALGLMVKAFNSFEGGEK